MTNSSGFTTLTPIGLQRTCFTSEEDRLNEFAKSLRVPIQTGEIIKGDPGEKGAMGPTGPTGPAGEPGIPPAPVSITVSVPAGVTSIFISGDGRKKTVNLHYEDLTTASPTIVGIMYQRYDGAGTTVYFNAATPNDKFRITITSF